MQQNNGLKMRSEAFHKHATPAKFQRSHQVPVNDFPTTIPYTWKERHEPTHTFSQAVNIAAMLCRERNLGELFPGVEKHFHKDHRLTMQQVNQLVDGWLKLTWNNNKAAILAARAYS